MANVIKYYVKPGGTIIKEVCDPQQYYFTGNGDHSMHSETTYYRHNEESLGPEGKGDTWIQVGKEEVVGAKPISGHELMENICHKDWLAWSNRDRIPIA